MPAASILNLPEELILTTLAHLPAPSLALVARSCKALRAIALDDQLWRSHIQKNVPYPLPSRPPSKSSWRHLYIDMSPYWFIPRSQIWVSDDKYNGGLIIARYSVAKHRIEAYRLTAQAPPPTEAAFPAMFWERNPEVLIAPFDPLVGESSLPMFTIDGHAASIPDNDYSYIRFPSIANPPVFLAHSLPSKAISHSTMVWPPPTLPSPSRVRNTSLDNFASRDTTQPVLPKYQKPLSE